VRRSAIISIAILALLLNSTLIAFAQGTELGGELAQSLNYDADARQIKGLRTDIKVYLERRFGTSGRAYLSFKGDYDAIANEGDINLDEAFASVYLKDIDITVGNQVISWGTADGFNPTSTINPVTLSLTDSLLKGKPILSAQATYYGDNFDLTAVLVPGFVPLETSDLAPLVQNKALLDYFEKLDIPSPENTLENMEFAVRLGTNLSGYDLYASYFYGWEDLPALMTKVNIDPTTMMPDWSTLAVEGRYRRTNVIGLATAGVLGDFGVWAEGAYFIPGKLDLAASNPLEIRQSLSIDEPYIQAVIGADYTFDNGIYAQAQYLYYGNGSLTMPYNLNPSQAIEPGHYLSNHFSYSFDMNNKVELTTLLNLKDNSAFIMPTYTRSLTQTTSLRIGLAAFAGSDGEFSNYPTQVSVQLTTVF